jgi:hypothetical protein
MDAIAINWIHHDLYGAILLRFPLHAEFAIHNNDNVYSLFCIYYSSPLVIQKSIGFNIVAWMRYNLFKVGNIYDIWINYSPQQDPDFNEWEDYEDDDDYYIEDGKYYYDDDD